MKQLLKNSKEVFIGKVISFKKTAQIIDSGSYPIPYYEIKINIDSSLIGDSTKVITVFTEASDCGQFLKVGTKYLVYAFLHRLTRRLILHQCHSACLEAESESAKNDLLDIKNLIRKPS